VEANDYVDPDSGDFGMPLVVVDYVPVADVKDVNGDGNPDIDGFLQNLQVTGRWGKTEIKSVELVGQINTNSGKVYVLALKDQDGNVLAYLAVEKLGRVTINNVEYFAILLYSANYDANNNSASPKNMLPGTRIEVTYPSDYYDPNGVPIQYWNEVRLTIAVDPSAVPIASSAGGPMLRVKLPVTVGAHQYAIAREQGGGSSKGSPVTPAVLLGALALIRALTPRRR